MKTHQIIDRPVITEKTTSVKERTGEVCFRVHPRATKPQIQRAVEQAFGVQVATVRTMNVAGKFRRQGRTAGYRSDWKKAWVKLRPGSKTIEYFEL